ncbi:hypothetical protein CLOP_g21912 [Closterium sp. NIES-67]|nr:hypothetical protein CLOP_g21912 [Closterium sp. NIES-67]
MFLPRRANRQLLLLLVFLSLAATRLAAASDEDSPPPHDSPSSEVSTATVSEPDPKPDAGSDSKPDPEPDTRSDTEPANEPASKPATEPASADNASSCPSSVLRPWVCACNSSLNPSPSPPPEDSMPAIDISFKGEFGYELIAVLPHAYWHLLNGTLRSTKSCGSSLSLLYYFSPAHATDPNCKRSNDHNHVIKEYGFSKGLHFSDIPENWHPPPLVYRTRELGRVWLDVPIGAPLVMISNKYEIEWAEPPANFIDVPTLLTVIHEFLNKGYYVVYNRPGKSIKADPEQGDRDDLGDHPRLAEEFGSEARFRTMQQIHEVWPSLDFNEVQFRMMARSSCFVSVQGGSSVLSSYWGGKNVIFYRKGWEGQGGAYERIYHRMSGAKIEVTKTYEVLLERLQEMIREERCKAV